MWKGVGILAWHSKKTDDADAANDSIDWVSPFNRPCSCTPYPFVLNNRHWVKTCSAADLPTTPSPWFVNSQETPANSRIVIWPAKALLIKSRTLFCKRWVHRQFGKEYWTGGPRLQGLSALRRIRTHQRLERWVTPSGLYLFSVDVYQPPVDDFCKESVVWMKTSHPNVLELITVDPSSE